MDAETALFLAEHTGSRAAWCDLIRTGYIWQLGGWYARMAAALIAAGEL